jgi:hypothetical protein
LEDHLADVTSQFTEILFLHYSLISYAEIRVIRLALD